VGATTCRVRSVEEEAVSGRASGPVLVAPTVLGVKEFGCITIHGCGL